VNTTRLRCALLALTVLPLVPAASASPLGLRYGATAGVGIVGPDQYDHGKAKGIFTAGSDGFFQPSDWLSFGGLGLGFRASGGIARDFSEIGITFPLITLRRGLWTTQTGMMIQRLNFEKHLFYVGTGISLPKSRGGRAQRRPTP
jgi:hypothetical protein